MNKPYILNQKQVQATDFQETQCIFVGGVRGGKTVSGGHFAHKNIIERPNEKGLIFANTNKQLNLSTLHEFIKILAYYGVVEGVHYVKNKNPEPYFGYKSMFDKHDGVWSFANKAQILTFSLEASFRGTEFGWCWGDEVQDAKKTDLDVVLARMSGSDNVKILYTLTPPKSNPYVNDLVFHNTNPNIKIIRSTTYDNQINLPDGYIEGLKERYDALTFEREVMGSEMKNIERRFAYAFEDRHIGKTYYNPKLALYGSLDFNVNPATGVFWQQGRDEDGTPFIHYLQEMVIHDGDVYKVCDWINANHGDKYLILTGDRTSLKREFTQRSKDSNTWTIIRKECRLTKHQIKLKTNPKSEQAQTLVNSILARHPNIKFHENMVNTIRDMRFVQVDEYNKIKKKDRNDPNQQADLLDCVKYSMWTFHQDFIKRK